MSSVKRFSESNSIMEIESRPESLHSVDEPASPPKGLRGMIRNMMSSRNRPRSPSAADHPPSAADAINDAQHAALSRSPSQQQQQQQQQQDRHRNPTPASTTTNSPRPSRSTSTSSTTPHRPSSFKFSLEYHPHAKAPGQIRLFPPRLPKPAQEFLQSRSARANGAQHLQAFEPREKKNARYTGRALAEWMMVVGECQSFFERRKAEGVPGNSGVETPVLGVEVFKRGGS